MGRVRMRLEQRMESLLILMKLVGVACLGAGGALLAAQMLRVDRLFAWLSARNSSGLRLVSAGVGVGCLAVAVAITTGDLRVDFSRLWVGMGLWFMIAAPMLAWPLLMSARTQEEAKVAEPLPSRAEGAGADPKRRAA